LFVFDAQDQLEASANNEEGDEEEDEEDDEEGEEIDYFADIPSEEEGGEEDDNGVVGAKYGDFFKPPEDGKSLTYDKAFEEMEGDSQSEEEEEEEEDEDEEEVGEVDDEEDDEEVLIGQQGKKKMGKKKAALLASAAEDEEDFLASGEEQESDFSGGEEGEAMDEEEDEEEEMGALGAKSQAAGDAGKSIFELGGEDEDASLEGLSTFEKQQASLKRKIGKFEDAYVGEKSWEKRGEASRLDRPADSLLEPEFEFEHATKPQPVQTTESTGDLETMIKRRITDQLFDDVVRKEDTLGADRRTSSVPEISEEQSKEGLGDLYEKDYREQVMGETAVDAVNKEEESIMAEFTHLCHKLDALANFHYAPKPPKEEIEVRANVAAISMEEAIPVGVSDGALLAPEEIYKKHKHLKEGRGGKGEDELTKEDRRARRRAKKKRGMKSSALNISVKGKEAKEAKKRGEPALVAASKEQDSDFSKSSKFFAKLQEDKKIEGAAPGSARNYKARDQKDAAPKRSANAFKL